jgi:4-hydroxy-tetrahydrodipicolinate synthase
MASNQISGVWLPIVTPFQSGDIDYKSLRVLIEYGISKGVTGIIPLGTTGESPVLTESECVAVAEKTVEIVNGRVPVFAGVGGSCTRHVKELLKKISATGINGILSVCPYYNRPSQDGLFEHFREVSQSTDLPIIMYNIPYRTGVNMLNDTVLKLAEIKNIVAIKDCSAVLSQSIELMASKPEGFSVLTGEDIFFLGSLVHGGNGGILASCHVFTEDFVKIYSLTRENNFKDAWQIWRSLLPIVRSLFAEPNPGPIKYCMYSLGIIDSPETRLPLVPISEGLKKTLDGYLHSR